MALDVMPIVLDNGAGYLKAGFAGESAPRILVPMLTTRNRTSWGKSEWFVGEHARAVRRDQPLNCPISHGQVTNFEELSIVWQYMYARELRTNPSERPVLITEHPHLPQYHRERMAEVAFEQLSVPAMYFCNQSVLSLYSVGLITGLSVDIGTETTDVTAVADTFILNETIKRRTIGGVDVTSFLQRLLISANPNVKQFITSNISQYFKERLCYISEDFASEDMRPSNVQPVSYRTPDGQVMNITNERYMAPEILFNPKQGGLEGNGIQHSVVAAIRDCPREVQPHAYENIVLSGGTTLFKGFPERLRQEVERISEDNSRVNVYAPLHRKYSVWIGGSILGSLKTFRDMMIKKTEYEEVGPSIVHQKCP